VKIHGFGHVGQLSPLQRFEVQLPQVAEYYVAVVTAADIRRRPELYATVTATRPGVAWWEEIHTSFFCRAHEASSFENIRHIRGQDAFAWRFLQEKDINPKKFLVDLISLIFAILVSHMPANRIFA